MEFTGYKLYFPVGIHIGNGSLEESEKTFDAALLFSALCIEAVKRGEEDLSRLVDISRQGRVLFSDAFPCLKERLYLPKPMISIERPGQGNSSEKKALKNLDFIPEDCLESFLGGTFDAETEYNRYKNGFCRKTVRTVASISHEEESVPYRLGVCQYVDGAGLYVIVGYQDAESLAFVKALLEALSYTGIGGKRSSGLGRFSFEEFELPEDFLRRLQEGNHSRCISLSACLPKDEELQGAMEGASYRLKKKSGFVASENYADTLLRKKDLFLFQAGSCFGRSFEGAIRDVSSQGSHPVYRYAKPLLMEV